MTHAPQGGNLWLLIVIATTVTRGRQTVIAYSVKNKYTKN